MEILKLFFLTLKPALFNLIWFLPLVIISRYILKSWFGKGWEWFIFVLYFGSFYFKNWIWFFWVLFFMYLYLFFYFEWIQQHLASKKEYVLLELIPPAEIKKPFRIMESVYDLLWGVLYIRANWKERWVEGIPLIDLMKGRATLEIVSLGGKVHYYFWCEKSVAERIKSSFYSQFPEMEIVEVEDYTLKIPKNIPNQKWDLYSEEFTFLKNEIYPIRTYSMFWEVPTEEKRVIEEKRIDPITTLLEKLIKIQSGEQLWLQIGLIPIEASDGFFFNEAKKEIEALGKGKKPTVERNPILKEIDFVLDTLKEILGGAPSPPSSSQKKDFHPETMLTPGEKETLKALQMKSSKKCFNCWIRIVHLYKKDEPHSRANFLIGRDYFQNFTQLNGIVFFGPKRTKIYHWLIDRRLYLRKRRNLREYLFRLPPNLSLGGIRGEPVHVIDFGLYPKGPGKWQKGTIVLCTEELATIFHFPLVSNLPGLPRVVSKQAPPPFVF
jgi:hypothetical protein